jgi:hypothetical protein
MPLHGADQFKSMQCCLKETIFPLSAPFECFAGKTSQPKESAFLCMCACVQTNTVKRAFHWHLGKILAVIFLLVHTIKHPFIDRHTIFPKKKRCYCRCVFFFSEFVSSLESYTHFSFSVIRTHQTSNRVVALRHFPRCEIIYSRRIRLKSVETMSKASFKK